MIRAQQVRGAIAGVERAEGAAAIMTRTRTHTTAVAVQPERARYDELKEMLEGRRREIGDDVRGRMRVVRAEAAERPHEHLDPGEPSDIDVQDDIELVMIQMKAETLNRIDEALARLAEGTYGHCTECGEDIAEARLRALPFAIRCRACEEARETSQLRASVRQQRGSSPLGFDLPSRR